MEEREGLPRWEPQSVDCVVWRSEGTIVRSELVAALRQPGISSTVVTHAFDAAAAALLAHRHRNEQRRRSPVVLVLVEPSTLDRCLEVVEVLQRFAAEVEFWVFQQMDGMHRLRVLRPADVERWKLEFRICPGNDGHDERPARPEIRVMEEFRTPRPPKLAASPPTETPVWSEGEATPRLLSDEELRMLLAPDSREPGDGTDGST
jgi:hypothetical protein